MPKPGHLPGRQRAALFKIKRFEDDTYGVIIEPLATADALIRRGLAVQGRRRSYARLTGLALNLTDAGRAYIAEIETP